MSNNPSSDKLQKDDWLFSETPRSNTDKVHFYLSDASTESTFTPPSERNTAIDISLKKQNAGKHTTKGRYSFHPTCYNSLPLKSSARQHSAFYPLRRHNYECTNSTNGSNDIYTQDIAQSEPECYDKRPGYLINTTDDQKYTFMSCCILLPDTYI